MKVLVEKLDDINVIIRGTIESPLVKKKFAELKEKAIRTIKNDMTLDDKVRAQKLTNLDDQVFQRDAESYLLQQFIEAGMSKADIKSEDTLGQPDFLKYEKQKNDIFIEVAIATQPYIDTNIEYMDIVPSYEKPQIDPKSVDKNLSEVAIRYAPFTKIKQPRAAIDGDLVILNFEGFFNGRALEGANEEAYKLKIGSGSLMQGFEEQVIGMNAGEKKIVNIRFPENYKAKELAGQETNFDVELLEIHEQLALSIDDTLAVKVLKDDKATLDLLKQKLTEQLESHTFSNLYNATLKPKIIQGLLSRFDFTLPNNAIEQEVDAKVNEKAQHMTKEERASYQDDKKKFQKLRDTLRKEARNSIKSALIVDALAKKENIEVTKNEVIVALEQQAKMAGKDPEELVEYYQTNNLMTSAKVGLIEDRLFSKMLGVEKL